METRRLGGNHGEFEAFRFREAAIFVGGVQGLGQEVGEEVPGFRVGVDEDRGAAEKGDGGDAADEGESRNWAIHFSR
jgi:hypothetical protein